MHFLSVSLKIMPRHGLATHFSQWVPLLYYFQAMADEWAIGMKGGLVIFSQCECGRTVAGRLQMRNDWTWILFILIQTNDLHSLLFT